MTTPAQPRTNGGNQTEIRRALPVATAIAEYLHVEIGDLLVADHTHETLSPGSASIACEGVDYDWPFAFTDTEAARTLSNQHGLFLEPINGCILAVYRA